MNSSYGLAPSSGPLDPSLLPASHESGVILANAQALREMQQPDVRLTAREQTIVLLMGHGLSNKRIARQLNIAPETVKSHAKRVFWKLTVQNRAQAVYRAAILGLI